MTTNRHLTLALSGALILLAGCGGHDGVELGAFPALNKTEGDAPFKLTAPTSKSPAPFSYTSSDQGVAKIEGDTVTVLKAGTTTITAQQGRMGSYYPTSTSALLTVAARVCTAPLVRENGVCVAPPTTAAYVTDAQLTWSPATFVMTWTEADAYCKNLSVKDLTGWKLPEQGQLVTLVASGMLNGQGWAAADAWTATAGSGADSHFAVNLSTGAATSFPKGSKAYVTCVR
ncbi:Lcl domain-containing protein [Massilia sp. GCM10023247]|uniref:Lcl domain-containing protein n=1 Tax=Massilia sp. GCM10023247 TaxID=3252643 RepID=UPI003616F309